MKRVLILRLALFFAIGLTGFVTYLGLDVLLSDYTLHDRRLGEGGAVALVCNIGLASEEFVFRRVAKKKGLRL